MVAVLVLLMVMFANSLMIYQLFMIRYFYVFDSLLLADC